MSKFNPGDKVRCLRAEFGNETVNKVYVVKASEHKIDGGDGLEWFRVESDDTGYANTYRAKNFELAEKAEKVVETPRKAGEFRLGDRVRVYSFTGSVAGTVISGPSNGLHSTKGNIEVAFDEEFDLGGESFSSAWASPKQCRRLKPRSKPVAAAAEADEYVITGGGQYFLKPGYGMTDDLSDAHIYTRAEAESCAWKSHGDVVLSLAEAKKRAGL